MCADAIVLTDFCAPVQQAVDSGTWLKVTGKSLLKPEAVNAATFRAPNHTFGHAKNRPPDLSGPKVRSRTPMKPSALAAAPATSQPQPAPLLAPQRTPVSPSHLPTPAPPRRPSAPPAPPPSSTASLPRSPRSSSHPPAQQPAHNPTTPPREHRTIHSIPAALTHCHASPRGAQEPSPHGCFWPWRSEEGAREAKMANSCVHARTAPPRRAPLPAPPVHADAPCSPFHPPAPPQPPPPAPTAGPSFMGLRSLLTCAPDVSRSADQRVWLAVEGGHRGGRLAG